MKIAIISLMRGDAWGGSEELWAATASRALEQGENVILSLPGLSADSRRVAEMVRHGAVVHRRRDSAYGRFDPKINRLTFPLRKLVRLRPDVYIVSQGMAFDAIRSGELREMLADCDRRDVPYILVSHGNSELGQQDPQKRAEGRAMFHGAYQAAFVSQSLVHLAERQLATRFKNAVVLDNPVNLSNIEYVPWPQTQSPVCMAHVARVEVYSKGVDLLLEALSTENWRQREWRLSVFGDGPGLGYLRELTDFMGLSDRVEFRGHTRDIKAVWADHHLMVLPSRTEGLPLAMVEAMVCGRPCVMTDVGGVTDWLQEPATGFIAEAPTPRSIRMAMERAWSVRDRWEQMGRTAHESAVSRLDKDPGQTLLDLARVSVNAYKTAPGAAQRRSLP